MNRVKLDNMSIIVELPILWGDMDAFAHVNNIRYFRFFESARIKYFEKVALYRLREECGIGPILAKTGCKYIRPLTYPDQIKVGCRTTAIAQDCIEQQYAVWSTKLDQIAAVGEATIKAYDYNLLQKGTFPTKLLTEIIKLEEKFSNRPESL